MFRRKDVSRPDKAAQPLQGSGAGDDVRSPGAVGGPAWLVLHVQDTPRNRPLKNGKNVWYRPQSYINRGDKIPQRRYVCVKKKWQNSNRTWSLQMRKCQRLVEWNLLGHPTVTSGKRQEVSSLGRSHSDSNRKPGLYIPTINPPGMPRDARPLTLKPQPRRHISVVRIRTASRALPTLICLSESQLPLAHEFTCKCTLMSSRMATCIFCKIIKGV